MQSHKIVIYQVLPRLFGNRTANNIQNGSIGENGCGKFNDFTDTALQTIKDAGYTHVWYIGVLAHASITDYTRYGIPEQYPEIIKGNAGSPYSIRDYYDVDPDLAVHVENRMQEFEELVDRTHKAGLKVIIDFVPNHLARNYRSVNKPAGIEDFGEHDDPSVAFSPQNNFYYLPGEALHLQIAPAKLTHARYHEEPAKVTGNDCFTNNPTQYDWYETVKLNYGVDYLNGRQTYFSPVPDTWIKMKDILLFWAAKQIDGFRCDMAEMVPLEFWRWVVPQIKEQYPGLLFIAEIYNPSGYRDFLADTVFDYLYDKVGLYDVLRDVSCGYRPASDITFTLNNVGDIQHKMLNFMENHDEQRLASDYFLKSGDKGIAAMVLTSCLNVNPVMIYFGQELGERGMDEEGYSGKNGRTTIFDYWSVDTVRRWNNGGKWNDELLTVEEKRLQQFYSKLIKSCHNERALSQGLFYDLMPANYDNPDFDSTKQFAFLRSDKKELIVVVANFDNHAKEVSIHIPPHAYAFFELNHLQRGKARPLFSGDGAELFFSPQGSLKVTLGAHSGEAYKISSL
jgi:glycosidase